MVVGRERSSKDEGGLDGEGDYGSFVLQALRLNTNPDPSTPNLGKYLEFPKIPKLRVPKPCKYQKNP